MKSSDLPQHPDLFPWTHCCYLGNRSSSIIIGETGSVELRCSFPSRLSLSPRICHLVALWLILTWRCDPRAYAGMRFSLSQKKFANAPGVPGDLIAGPECTSHTVSMCLLMARWGREVKLLRPLLSKAFCNKYFLLKIKALLLPP